MPAIREWRNSLVVYLSLHSTKPTQWLFRGVFKRRRFIVLFGKNRGQDRKTGWRSKIADRLFSRCCRRTDAAPSQSENESEKNHVRVQLINGEQINRTVASDSSVKQDNRGRRIGHRRIFYYFDRVKLNFTIHLIRIKERCRLPED